MPKFRKKPVLVDARQYDGKNAHDLCEWITGKKIENPFALSEGVYIKQKVFPGVNPENKCLWFLAIKTPEGEMEAAAGDWVIRGVKGEFYPCKPDIFETTYEAVEE
jgi:hypothetical protein